MKFRALLVVLLATTTLRAFLAPTSFTWTGNTGASVGTASNWNGGVAPVSNSSTTLIFGTSSNQFPIFAGLLEVNSLVFSAGHPHYFLVSSDATPSQLRLGAGGLTLNGTTSSYVDFTHGFTLELLANQTWATGSNLSAYGDISGAFALTKTGSGSLRLGGANTFGGGLTVSAGTLFLASDTVLYTPAENPGGLAAVNSLAFLAGPAGTGTLTMSNGTTLAADTKLTLPNALNFSGTLNLDSPDGGLTLSGLVTALTSTVTLNITGNSPVFFQGGFAETLAGTTYRFTRPAGGISNGAVLTGPSSTSPTSSYTGGTIVDDVALFFMTPGSLPATGAISGLNAAYIGVGYNGGLTALLGKITAKSTYSGSLGFDTDPRVTSATTIFADAIDLSAFNKTTFLGLGSFTRSEITGPITPPSGGNFRFGGGGGTLIVSSSLGAGGTGDVKVSSNPGQPLTVIFKGNNSYAGNLSVDGSAVILDSTTALPAGANYRLAADSYLGYTQNFTAVSTPAAFISRLAAGSYTATSILGFDSPLPTNPRTITDPVNLSALNPIYLGSATKAILTGTISVPTTGTTAAGYNTLFLAGVRSGYLKISSALAPANGITQVVVGSATSANALTAQGTIELAAANTYAGGTTLYAGTLLLGSSSALGTATGIVSGPLGTGPLTIPATSPSTPGLASTLASSTLHNPINIQAHSLRVGVEVTADSQRSDFLLQSLTANALVLNGLISGPAALDSYGSGLLTLGGANTFSGGLHIYGTSNVVANHNTALGLGLLDLFNNTSVTFTTSAPVVGGLSAGSGSLILAPGSTLTINQAQDRTFGGTISGTGAALVKNGSGELYLSGTNTYSGGTTINQGTLALGTTGNVGTGAITLNGGKLVSQGVNVPNPILFGPSGGTLGGSGSFSSPITVGPNVALSPGNSPGTTTFTSGLTFASGGLYQLEIQSALGTPGVGYDTINVSGGQLVFTATLANKFNLTLVSLDHFGTPGVTTDFFPNNAYSLQIATAPGGITGFSSDLVAISTTSFANVITGGVFSLVVAGSAGSTSSGNTALYLNYTPVSVPEPSTWALLALGLATLALASRRRA